MSYYSDAEFEDKNCLICHEHYYYRADLGYSDGGLCSNCKKDPKLAQLRQDEHEKINDEIEKVVDPSNYIKRKMTKKVV